MDQPALPGKERRTTERKTLRTAAQLKLPSGHVVDARTLDIGKGGAGVVSDYNLVVGAKVAVRITLPVTSSGGVVFEATATVANCTLASKDGGFRLGLQFQPLETAAAAALKALLS
ncbi:PilZ domain-containing protein [Roseateles cellulosilyticus]|uniref:PilZ domain-containing protein n=1 Tax=Pelomonas cellulosilytica TaxID=2906762 RepID=A0ABS8XSE8_9BURK|nr:PilZ domain-containing protein [Pelomonas sp. P8]MCE4553812.1 PilZ domain-containing protein [Pelomonas sp. P8]